MALAVFGAQAVLIYSMFLVPQNFLKLHAHYFYFLHYALFLPFLFRSRDRCAFLFSPSFLIITYVCFSFTVGGFAFSHAYVLSRQDLVDFWRWSHFNTTTAYFMSCNVCAMFAYFLARRGQSGGNRHHEPSSLQPYIPQLAAGGILLVVFSVVGLGLSAFGGSGNFSIVPREFGFLVIAVVLTKTRWRYRFLAYVGLLLLFAAAQYSNRRVVLLLGLSVVFIEAAHLQDLRLSFRRVLTCVVVIALAALLQVTMTIARGMDGFKGSYWQTFSRIGNFVGLENAATYSLKQTEGPSTFFHSCNGVNYVFDDPSLLTYGSTLAKVLFIPVPRMIMPSKPASMVDIYTTRWNPAWRRAGCSTGIDVYAEYFWNFHVFGVFFAAIIPYFLNRAFFFYLSRLRAGNVWPFIYVAVGYDVLLMYARGHGLHSLVIEVALAFGVQVVLFNLLVAMLAGTRWPHVSHGRLACRQRYSVNHA